jgi:hypothetical protein
MAIVIISSVDEKTRRELAERLAQKLDCSVLSREEIVERATESGVPVGRLEIAVLKQSVPKERLARHKAQYLALGAAVICERCRERPDLVYHGRAGNMLLQGISHVLRIRVVPNTKRRVAATAERLKLSREKASEYIERLDQDIANWVHFAHGVDMNDPHQYDLMLNLDQISIESACATACVMAQLPELQPTPASRRIMEDLCLAARARERLGRDARTAGADLTVSARDGLVTVTYMPAQAEVADAIPLVLGNLEGARQLVATMAVTNLLWIAERFDPGSRAYAEVTDLARRWGAAVELALLLPSNGDGTDVQDGDASGAGGPAVRYVPKSEDETGGIEEDVGGAPRDVGDDGLVAQSEALISDGLFGGSQMWTGGTDQVVQTVRSRSSTSLIIVGDIFVSRGAASRVRLTRELCSSIRERTRVPVLQQHELRGSLLVDRGHLLRMVASLILLAGIYGLLFTHQRDILEFLGGADWKSWRVVATLAVALTAPVVAYLYGGVTGTVLSWLKFE